MFGIGALEFFVIAMVALLVIGPKELPRALYHFGRIMRKIRGFTAEIQSSIDAVTSDIELEDIAKEANKAGDELTDFRVEQQQALEIRDSNKKAPHKKTSKKKVKKKTVKKKAKEA